MKFRVVDTLGEKIMYEFISWLRYVEFDGDAALLYLAKNDAIGEAQKKRQNQNPDSDTTASSILTMTPTRCPSQFTSRKRTHFSRLS